jgi:hypothetical protein
MRSRPEANAGSAKTAHCAPDKARSKGLGFYLDFREDDMVTISARIQTSEKVKTQSNR